MTTSADHQHLSSEIERLEREVAQQEAIVRRGAARGWPSQSDEDKLRQLQRKLSDLKDRFGSH